MDKWQEKIDEIKSDFLSCQQVLLAIGDETRQNIILTLMCAPGKTGWRVGEITEKTHLSRPAVSHHLKILKDAGIIRMYEEGTMNFYYIDVRSNLGSINKLMDGINYLFTNYASEFDIGAKSEQP